MDLVASASPQPASTAAQQLVRQCLEKLQSEASSSARSSQRQALLDSLAAHQPQVQLAEQSNVDAGGTTSRFLGADYHWEPFRLACHPANPARLREVALDCLQKLVAHRHLRGALRLPAATQAQSSRKRPDGGSEASSVRQSTVEPPATATATASTASSSFFLIDEIIQTVCSAFQLSPNQYVVAEEPVQLQVLKVLLTAITTTSCEVHGVSLLKVIQTCFSIHLNSRNPINQGTAKAILTQTINLVFSRMESYADVLAKKLKEEADVVAAAATTTTTTVHSSDPDTRSINTTSVEFSSHSSSSSTSPAAGSDFDNKDSSPRSSSVVDIRNEKLHSSSSSDDDGIATTTPPVEPATTNVLSSSHSPQTLPSVLNQPKSDSTTDENGMIRIKTTPTNLITTTSTTTTFTDYPTSAYPKSPASSSTNTDSNNNPYDPTIAYYNDLLRKDVFLAFRLLCRLSTHTDNPTQNAESSTQAFSAAAVNQQQGFTDDLSQTSIKARAVAMELILSILNTSGPVLQTDDMYVNLVRQHLCLTVARNGISTHPHLFELSLSIFLMILRIYRSRLVLEIEIILNTVYLHILEMGNSTYKQKSMVLQALLKICENPQTLIDIFLNYDCNLGAVSVFERIVNVCARCAQGGRIDGTDEGGSASSPGNTSSSSSSTSTTAAATSKTSSGGGLMGLAATTAFGLTGLVGEYVGVGTSKAEAIRLQEKRLKIRSLLCLVAIVNSLVEWSIQIAPKVPIVGAGGKLMLPDSGSSTGSSSSQDSSPTSAKNTNASLSNGALYGSRKGSLVNLTTATVSNGSNYVIVAVENGSSGGENSITTSTSSRSFLDALGPANQSHPVLVDKRPLNSVSLTKATVVGAKLASQAGSTGIVSSTSNINGCSDDTAASQIEEMTSRKQQLRQCIKLFNSKPNKGVKQMIEAGFTTDDPVECARFLKSTQGLDKAAIGDFIGDVEPFNIKVMHAFIDSLSFTSVDFVPALRLLLQTFRLPGEAQKIDRIMEKFADRYCENNPGIFAHADTAYTLAYSVIMLNTDQHSSKIRHRMDKAAFIKNNRGINDNADLPDEFLSAIFDEIHNNEIVMEEEQAGQFAALAVGWGAGDLVNDRTRMEMYRKEMALIQKKSQMLIKAAFGGAKGGTASSASQQMVFRTAVHADLARPMFAMASWPMMATFSLLFEAADDTDDSDFSKATADSGLDNSPLGKSGSAESTKVADLCLQGFAAAIRVASLFKMETERDAFVSSLAKMTGLSHVSEMRMKNVAAIQTLIALASILGEYLESSWDDVLKIASSVERLQLAWNTAMDNMSGGNDGKLAGGMVGGSNAPINETVSSLKRTPGDGRRPIERRGSELLSPGASLLLPRRSVSYVRSDDLVMALSNGKLVNPTLQKVLSEISSQSMAISVDKIFSDTVQLSSSAIIHFFKAMCLVSLEEVGLESASAGTSAASTPLVTNVAIIGDPRRSSISSQSSSYRDNLMSPPPLSAGSAAISAMTGPPRMYLLQKIVEIAYYNIHRIRFEWSQIWRILQPHFNTVACHPNFAVATFAVDSLRQLSMKFLERDELSHYSTQHEFLRNFEWIMRHNVHTGIRELILSSLTQMMGARASNIKSGWKCIFTVLCKAATPPGHVAARGDVAPPPSLNLNGGLLMTFKEWERLAQLSFNIFESCFEKYFEVIIRAGAFVDYVSTLAEFVLLEGSGQVHDEIVSSSLKIGAECGKWLINQAEVENRNSLTSRGTSLSLEHISNSTNSTSIQNNESESSIGLSPVDGGDGGAKFIRRESAANAFSMVARQLMSPYLQPNGLISEDHFFLKWFPLLSSLGRIINDSENETVRNQTIENLFETLKAAAYLFETKYWKQIHRSIILPIFEDFKESSLRRGSVTTTGGAIGGGSAALTTSQQLRDSANSSSWLLAIQHLVELYTDIFDRITGMSNSGMDIVHSVFDLVISLLSKRDERLAATGQVCLEQFIQKNIGKLVVLGGGGAESRLWEIFTHGIERAAWTTLPAELLNCDSAVGSSSNGEGGSLHSRRPTFDSSSSYSAPTTIDGNDQHPQQQVQDPPAANTSTDSSTSTHPLPLDNSPMTIPPSATRTALRLAQSVAEGKNAAIRALTLGTERLDDVVPITSLDDLDFEHTIVKCGTHLEFVDAVRTICLTRVVATSSNNNEDEVAGASYSGTKKKRGAGQHAATHLADIGEDELMDARLVVNQSDDSLNNAANNTITSSATSTTTPSTARPPYVINLIPSTYRARWLRCVYDSYTFARAFNENFDVRKAILKKRLVKQMPNLVKQETTSCATYIELLFAIYKYQGDEEEDNAGVIVKQEHHQPSLSSPSSTTILSTLLREVIDVLERYVEYLQDQQRNQRDVGLWSPVVVVILRELVKTRSLWTTSGSTSISPITVNGVTAATGGLEESLINKYIGLSRSLPSLFLLGARMIRTDRPEVRQVLQDFIVAGLQVKIE